MNRTLDALLDDLGGYLGLPDNACFSLPREAYISKELHEIEVKEIFEKSWLCVGRDEYVPNPGDFYTIDVMGEPVIVVRATDGQVRALNAACRHRSMLVAQGRGNAKRFTCPYHAWTYGTDGHLIGAPHMEQSPVFDKKACSLPQYRLDSWMSFLFVNLDDDAAPLQPVMASMKKAVANYRIGEQIEIFHYEAAWEGNWKLSAENSMEYYHHIALHAGTVGVQMPARGTYSPAVPATDETFTHERCRMGESFLGGYLLWKDIAIEDPELGRQRRDMIEKVNYEDSLATSELAKAMRSRKATRGPLSHFEGTVAQFYKYLARTLAAERALTHDRARADLMKTGAISRRSRGRG